MTRETLDKANKLTRSQQRLNDLRGIIVSSYPRIFYKKNKKTGFYNDGNSISFADLDDITRERLEAAMLSVIDARDCEIDEEMKRLK